MKLCLDCNKIIAEISPDGIVAKMEGRILDHNVRCQAQCSCGQCGSKHMRSGPCLQGAYSMLEGSDFYKTKGSKIC